MSSAIAAALAGGPIPRLSTGEVDVAKVPDVYQPFVAGPAVLQADLVSDKALEAERFMNMLRMSVTSPLDELRRLGLPLLVGLGWKPLLIAVTATWLMAKVYREAADVLIGVIKADPPPAAPEASEAPATAPPEASATAPLDAPATAAPDAPVVSEGFADELASPEAEAAPPEPAKSAESEPAKNPMPPMWKRLLVAAAAGVVAWLLYKALGLLRVGLPLAVDRLNQVVGSNMYTRTFWTPQARKMLRLFGYVLLGHAAALPVAVAGVPRLAGHSLDVVTAGYFTAFGLVGRVFIGGVFVVAAVLYAMVRLAAVLNLVAWDAPVMPL